MNRRQFLQHSGRATAGLAAASLLRLPGVAADTASASTLKITPKCLWGVHCQPRGTQPEEDAILNIEQAVGRTFATVRRNYPWDHPLTCAKDVWIAQGGRTSLTSWLAIRSDGSIVKWRDIYQGHEDAWIKTQARNAIAFGHPFYLIFHHEPENEPNGTADEYVKAWLHIHNLFARVGVTNVTWVLALMASTYKGGWGGPDIWYPGQDVQMIGADGYNWFPCRPWMQWRPFSGIFSGLLDFAVAKSKPVYIVEWGCQEQTACGHSGSGRAKADWIADAVQTIKSWPRVKAASYSHAKNAPRQGSTCSCNWRIDTSTNSLVAFKTAGLDTYFLGG